MHGCRRIEATGSRFQAAHPSGVNVVTAPSFIRASPSPVPIHSDPSLPASRQRISPLGSIGFECSSKVAKFTPSNRTSPTSVPSHRNPSAVCASAWMVFCGSPFSITQPCRFRLASGVVGSSAWPRDRQAAPRPTRSERARQVSRQGRTSVPPKAAQSSSGLLPLCPPRFERARLQSCRQRRTNCSGLQPLRDVLPPPIGFACATGWRRKRAPQLARRSGKIPFTRRGVSQR